MAAGDQIMVGHGSLKTSRLRNMFIGLKAFEHPLLEKQGEMEAPKIEIG
jgi:hypothetical protein